MKNRIIRILFASALSFTAVSAFAGVSVSNHICEQPIKVEAGEGSYYSSISDSLTGTELLNALHTLNSQKRTRTVGYNGMKTFAAKCDVDPDGSGKIIGFYDNKKVGPGWDSAAMLQTAQPLKVNTQSKLKQLPRPSHWLKPQLLTQHIKPVSIKQV